VADLRAGETNSTDPEIYVTSASRLDCPPPRLLSEPTALTRNGQEVIAAAYGFDGLPGGMVQCQFGSGAPFSPTTVGGTLSFFTPNDYFSGAQELLQCRALGIPSRAELKLNRAPELQSLDAALNSGDANSDQVRISGDGRYVAFSTLATLLGTGSLGGMRRDVVMRDRYTGAMFGIPGATGTNSVPDLSYDGRFMVFESTAAYNGNDNNSSQDIYLYDRFTGAVSLVSANASGTAAGNGTSQQPRISGDGRYVVFKSNATNLDSTLTSSGTQVFIRDLLAVPPVTRLVSRNTSNNGGGNGASAAPVIDNMGTHVAYESDANDLLMTGDTNGLKDVFVATINPTTLFAASPTVPAPPTVRASANGATQGNGASFGAAISGDGGTIAFSTDADNLGGVPNLSGTEIYTYQFSSGILTQLLPAQPVEAAFLGVRVNASLDFSGQMLVFETGENLAVGDSNSAVDVYVVDLSVAPALRNAKRISLRGDGTEAALVAGGFGPAISAFSRLVGFTATGVFSPDVDAGSLTDVHVSPF
jgi:hypothetical protein